MKDKSTEDDFSPEEAVHIKAIVRRAHWLEKRLADSEPERGGAQYDMNEYAALLWALQELGADYQPSRFAPVQVADETPPVRPDAQEWTPRARPDMSTRTTRAPARYFPRGVE